MERVTARRFLVRSLFDGERICQLRLVDLTGPCLSMTPFERETPSTIFVDSRVILLDNRGPSPSMDEILELLASGRVEAGFLRPCLAVAGITPSDCVDVIAY